MFIPLASSTKLHPDEYLDRHEKVNALGRSRPAAALRARSQNLRMLGSQSENAGT
jgi:hypothetical protein